MTLHNRAHTPILSNSLCLQAGQDEKEHFLSSTTMQEESNSILRTKEQLQPPQEKMMMTVMTCRRAPRKTMRVMTGDYEVHLFAFAFDFVFFLVLLL